MTYSGSPSISQGTVGAEIPVGEVVRRLHRDGRGHGLKYRDRAGRKKVLLFVVVAQAGAQGPPVAELPVHRTEHCPGLGFLTLNCMAEWDATVERVKVKGIDRQVFVEVIHAREPVERAFPVAGQPELLGDLIQVRDAVSSL